MRLLHAVTLSLVLVTIIFNMAIPAYGHINKGEVMEQEETALAAEMESLEEEMAGMMAELEDDTAMMQPNNKKKDIS